MVLTISDISAKMAGNYGRARPFAYLPKKGKNINRQQVNEATCFPSRPQKTIQNRFNVILYNKWVSNEIQRHELLMQSSYAGPRLRRASTVCVKCFVQRACISPQRNLTSFLIPKVEEHNWNLNWRGYSYSTQMQWPDQWGRGWHLSLTPNPALTRENLFLDENLSCFVWKQT